MMFRTALILILFAGAVSAAPQFTSNQYLSGPAGMVSSSAVQWESGTNIMHFGSDETWNGGAAGSLLVTGPGTGAYSRDESLAFPDQVNEYSSSDYLEYKGSGAIYWDSLAMSEGGPNRTPALCDEAGNWAGDIIGGQTPYQHAVQAEFQGVGSEARYQSSKFVSGSDYALSGRASGIGSWSGDYHSYAEAGWSQNSSSLNYENQVWEHHIIYANETGEQFNGIQDWVWNSWDSPFEMNETPANETVNETVEEA